jgi:hypothetical protein
VLTLVVIPVLYYVTYQAFPPRHAAPAQARSQAS